jgi:hypothetical protein
MSKQWQDKTRGGHYVKGIYRDPLAHGSFVFHGKVCLNMGGQPPSDNPREWQGECWSEDGRYYDGPESDLDLMEAQHGE